jgi:hypothetical protein
VTQADDLQRSILAAEHPDKLAEMQRFITPEERFKLTMARQ